MCPYRGNSLGGRLKTEHVFTPARIPRDCDGSKLHAHFLSQMAKKHHPKNLLVFTIHRLGEPPALLAAALGGF